jgi:hypothetical protein
VAAPTHPPKVHRKGREELRAKPQRTARRQRSPGGNPDPGGSQPGLRPWKWCSGWDLFRGFAPAFGLVPA